MTEAAFDDLVKRIRNSLDCSKELAADYAKGIGETPEIQNGQVLVRNEDKRIIARIPESVLAES
jgi:hypothetical protein